MALAKLSRDLELYSRRELTLRLVQYGSLLVSALGQRGAALKILATKCSETRTLLRFFDDIPMLQHSMDYGLGQGKDSDVWIRILNVVNNAFDQAFYPLEHLSWLIDHKLMAKRSNPFNNLSVICWTASLLLHVIKAMRYLQLLKETEERLRLRSKGQDLSSELQRIQGQRHFHYLSLVQATADLCNAVNWLEMPESTKRLIFGMSGLKEWHIGLFGTISSVIAIYKRCI